MKLKCEFVTMEIADEVVAVPVGDNAQSYHLVLKLNEEGQKILELLNKETTVEGIIREIEKEYSIEDDVLKQYINEILDKLRQHDLIEE